MPKQAQTGGIIYKRCYFDWGGRCAYCGMGLPRIKRLGKVQATVDHFIPLSKGGRNARFNRVLACFDCNMAKDNIDPRETNQWPDVAKRLAEIAATPNISHKRLKTLVTELAKEVFVEPGATPTSAEKGTVAVSPPLTPAP